MTTAPQPQSVTVILVNWNGAEFLRPCLESIATQDHAGKIRVLMVDNGSTDGSVQLVRGEHPDVTIIENQENNYAAANNLGVDQADSEFVLLLNTDTVLQPDAVRRLVEVLDAHPGAAGVAPKILYPDGRNGNRVVEYNLKRIQEGKDPDPGLVGEETIIVERRFF